MLSNPTGFFFHRSVLLSSRCSLLCCLARPTLPCTGSQHTHSGRYTILASRYAVLAVIIIFSCLSIYQYYCPHMLLQGCHIHLTWYHTFTLEGPSSYCQLAKKRHKYNCSNNGNIKEHRGLQGFKKFVLNWENTVLQSGKYSCLGLEHYVVRGHN